MWYVVTVALTTMVWGVIGRAGMANRTTQEVKEFFSGTIAIGLISFFTAFIIWCVS